jgi:hypothetical protein
MLADRHPAAPQDDLIFNYNTMRHLLPELYNAQEKALLRRGWHMYGIAALLIIGWFLVAAFFVQ